MSGLTRQDMKRDEIRDRLIRAVDWIATNVQKILIAIGVIVLVLIATWAVGLVMDGRANAAQSKLALALDVASAPILEIGAEPDSETAPSFATEEAKRSRMRELLVAVPARTDAGEVASVYLGDLAAKEGRADEARERWQRFVDNHRKHALAAVVESSLISLDRQEGRTDELIIRLRGLESSSSATLPRDVLLFELGVTLEEAGQEEDAASTFKTLTEEFPQSPFAARARTRPSFSTES